MQQAIASVPNYKIFVFGGQQGGDNRSDWKYVKNVNCLDCGSMQWMSSDAIGSSFVEGLFPEVCFVCVCVCVCVCVFVLTVYDVCDAHAHPQHLMFVCA